MGSQLDELFVFWGWFSRSIPCVFLSIGRWTGRGAAAADMLITCHTAVFRIRTEMSSATKLTVGNFSMFPRSLRTAIRILYIHTCTHTHTHNTQYMYRDLHRRDVGICVFLSTRTARAR